MRHSRRCGPRHGGHAHFDPREEWAMHGRRGDYRRGGPGFGAPRGRRARRGAVKAAVLVPAGRGAPQRLRADAGDRGPQRGRLAPEPRLDLPGAGDDGGRGPDQGRRLRRPACLRDHRRRPRAPRAARRRRPAPWEPAEDDVSDGTVELGRTIRQVGMAVRQISEVGTAEQLKQAEQVLAETRRSLYGLLAEDPDADGSTRLPAPRARGASFSTLPRCREDGSDRRWPRWPPRPH